MTELKHGISTVVFFDKPNLDFVEKRSLSGKKINHNELFSLLAKNERELYVRFYWRSNEGDSPYGDHLERLRTRLQARGIRLVGIQTSEDVDQAIFNDLSTILFDTDDSSTRPAKIILCSGDKAFSNIIGIAKRRLNISTTVISGRDHCAEALKEASDEIIFIEEMVSNNENLLLVPPASNK